MTSWPKVEIDDGTPAELPREPKGRVPLWQWLTALIVVVGGVATFFLTQHLQDTWRVQQLRAAAAHETAAIQAYDLKHSGWVVPAAKVPGADYLHPPVATIVGGAGRAFAGSFTPEGWYFTAGTGPLRPVSKTVNYDSQLTIVGEGSGRIIVWSMTRGFGWLPSAGGAVTYYYHQAHGSTPYPLAADAQGNLYGIQGSAPKSVWRLSLSGKFSPNWAALADPVAEIAVAPDGTLYVGHLGITSLPAVEAYAIDVFRPSGKFETVFALPPSVTTGMDTAVFSDAATMMVATNKALILGTNPMYVVRSRTGTWRALDLRVRSKGLEYSAYGSNTASSTFQLAVDSQNRVWASVPHGIVGIVRWPAALNGKV